MMTVTVYSTGTACVRCTMTVRALTAAGVPHVEVDVRTSPAASAFTVIVQRTHAVPVL